MKLTPTTEADLPAINSLLATNNLHTKDVDLQKMKLFKYEIDEALAACVGFEHFGDTALLRSVAVADGHKSKGIGKALVEQALVQAHAAGITRIYLLTIDADGFFKKLGFEIIDKEDAPDAIKSTVEYSQLCPASAHCMKLSL